MQKTCSGVLMIDFAKLVHALQYISGKLAPRYNYIPDISAPLHMHSGH